MFKLNRRQWLSTCAAGSGALLLGPSSVRAGQGPAKKLVVLTAVGGWDATYALDPKPGVSGIDAPLAGDVQTINGIPLLIDPARPAVTDFFTDFGDLTAVVNGLQTQTISHTTGRRRIMTGTSLATAADMGTLTALEHGADLGAPYLVLGTVSFSGAYPALATRTGQLNQLGTLLNPFATFPLKDAPPITERYVPTPDEVNAMRARVVASAAEHPARGLIGRNGRLIGDYERSLERADLLKEVGALAGFDSTQSLDIQVDLALDALDSGMSQAIQLQQAGFDTHTNNAQQSQLWQSLFANLQRLMQGLEQRGLLEDTVVVVVSELGRTPKLNDALGKDHWPITSAMVIGTDVAGGRTVGASDDSLGGRNVDLATGQLDDNGSQLRPGNFVAGVLDLVGVDPAEHLGDSITPLGLRG